MSSSFLRTSQIASQPLVASMGPLSRIIAYAVDHSQDTRMIQAVTDSLNILAETVLKQWRETKLSEVDVTEESIYLDEQTLTKTLPVLWKLLRSCLFATVIVLTAITGRILNDRRLGSDRG